MTGETMSTAPGANEESTMSAEEKRARAEAPVAKLALVTFTPDERGKWTREEIRPATYTYTDQ